MQFMSLNKNRILIIKIINNAKSRDFCSFIASEWNSRELSLNPSKPFISVQLTCFLGNGLPTRICGANLVRISHGLLARVGIAPSGSTAVQIVQCRAVLWRVWLCCPKLLWFSDILSNRRLFNCVSRADRLSWLPTPWAFSDKKLHSRDKVG